MLYIEYMRLPSAHHFHADASPTLKPPLSYPRAIAPLSQYAGAHLGTALKHIKPLESSKLLSLRASLPTDSALKPACLANCSI